MKKILIQFIFTLFCCSFLLLLLFYSAECISLASNGLLIWYKNMIPSLFPFMVLSGFMVRSGLSLKIGQWLQPVLGLFFRLPSQMLYAIFMGFLCGFPMGAKIVADMLEKEQITLKEGEYLLAFCNNKSKGGIYYDNKIQRLTIYRFRFQRYFHRNCRKRALPLLSF